MSVSIASVTTLSVFSGYVFCCLLSGLGMAIVGNEVDVVVKQTGKTLMHFGKT
jgi:hypothetical protein